MEPPLQLRAAMPDFPPTDPSQTDLMPPVAAPLAPPEAAPMPPVASPSDFVFTPAVTSEAAPAPLAPTLDASMRRLPVYLVLDCSGSMNGEPIEAVRQGMKTLLGELKSDPQALETVWMSVITFDSTAHQVMPLTELVMVKEPTFEARGTTALGAALTMLLQNIQSEVRKTTPTQKGDWKPLIFLMTDGIPTDSWEGPADAIKAAKPGNFIACAAGGEADENTLKRMTDIVVRLNDLQPDALKQFFKWVSASVATTSTGIAKSDSPIALPAPPPEIVIVP